MLIVLSKSQHNCHSGGTVIWPSENSAPGWSPELLNYLASCPRVGSKGQNWKIIFSLHERDPKTFKPNQLLHHCWYYYRFHFFFKKKGQARTLKHVQHFKFLLENEASHSEKEKPRVDNWVKQKKPLYTMGFILTSFFFVTSIRGRYFKWQN